MTKRYKIVTTNALIYFSHRPRLFYFQETGMLDDKEPIHAKKKRKKVSLIHFKCASLSRVNLRNQP